MLLDWPSNNNNLEGLLLHWTADVVETWAKLDLGLVQQHQQLIGLNEFGMVAEKTELNPKLDLDECWLGSN